MVFKPNPMLCGIVIAPTVPSPAPKDFHGKVTVRECFLFIGKNAVTDTAGISETRSKTLPSRSLDIIERPKSRAASVSKVKFSSISDDKDTQPLAKVVSSDEESSDEDEPQSKTLGRQTRSQTSRLPSTMGKLSLGHSSRDSPSASESPASVSMSSDGHAVIKYEF